MMKRRTLIPLMVLPLVAVAVLSFKNRGSDGNAETKYVYLTFDDGPLAGSEKVNDAILYEKVPITVLLVGKHAESRPHYVELYKNNPHIEVGNHSYSHARNHYSTFYHAPEGVLADFNKARDLLGLHDKVARLPGRNMWRLNGRSKSDVASGKEAADLLAKQGYKLYGWDMEWFHDPKTTEPVGSAQEIFEHIESLLDSGHTFTEDHLVLLCHDEQFRKDWEETELKKLIELLKTREDYEFRHLEDYPNS